MNHKLTLIAIILAAFASMSFAQVGIARSNSGIHVPSAQTMGQGILFVSGSFEMVSDGKSLSIDGTYTDAKGQSVDIDNNTPSNDESLYLSFGLNDRLEIDARLPLHYDGKIKDTKLDGFGLGDFQLGAKGSYPVNDWMSVGISGELILPSGARDRGFRPRHRWYIRDDDESYAFTSDSWVIAGYGHLTTVFGDILTFNGYAGILKTFGISGNYILWGAGFNVFPEKILTPTIEISGETPIRTSDIAHNMAVSPIRITPGLRLHLPYATELTISGDVGINYFRKEKVSNGFLVDRSIDGKDIRYAVYGTPTIGMAITLSKQFDFSWRDSDNDGVIDRKDMCPGTSRNMVVNARGCPVDEDQDGILNIVDECPGTPLGLVVGYNGCPLDLDNDKVYDYLDKCLGTPEGFAVDADGCTLDTDNDGIDDNNDKCPNTLPNDAVDSTGCPLDQDHDGVPNKDDLCPNTPEGISIDVQGCPLDHDMDGIPDDLDKCPNSAENEKVDEYGCPADEDKDGVPDSRDQCPETPQNVGVDEKGCRLDKDGDGIFDEEDKCPNTPKDAPIDSLGCPLDTDKDGIADWMDQCPGTVKKASVDGNGCPINARLNMNSVASRIIFKSGDTVLVNSSYTALNDIIAMMRQHPVALVIECSASGSKYEGESLGESRAKTIYNYLEKKGIAMDRLKYQGYEGGLPKINPRRGDESNGVRLTPYTLQE